MYKSTIASLKIDRDLVTTDAQLAQLTDVIVTFFDHMADLGAIKYFEGGKVVKNVNGLELSGILNTALINTVNEYFQKEDSKSYEWATSYLYRSVNAASLKPRDIEALAAVGSSALEVIFNEGYHESPEATNTFVLEYGNVGGELGYSAYILSDEEPKKEEPVKVDTSDSSIASLIAASINARAQEATAKADAAKAAAAKAAAAQEAMVNIAKETAARTTGQTQRPTLDAANDSVYSAKAGSDESEASNTLGNLVGASETARVFLRAVVNGSEVEFSFSTVIEAHDFVKYLATLGQHVFKASIVIDTAVETNYQRIIELF